MRDALVLCLVQLAQMETGWVVGWTSVLTTALVMSKCSSQRMENRLGGGRRGDKKEKVEGRCRGGGEMRTKRIGAEKLGGGGMR